MVLKGRGPPGRQCSLQELLAGLDEAPFHFGVRKDTKASSSPASSSSREHCLPGGPRPFGIAGHRLHTEGTGQPPSEPGIGAPETRPADRGLIAKSPALLRKFDRARAGRETARFYYVRRKSARGPIIHHSWQEQHLDEVLEAAATARSPVLPLVAATEPGRSGPHRSPGLLGELH